MEVAEGPFGDEVCQVGTCASGTPLDCDDMDECTADSCDEVSGCGNVPIPHCGAAVPTTSEWGQALLIVLLVTTGALFVARKREFV